MGFKIAELFAELKIKDAPFNVKMKRVRKNLGLTNKNISAFTTKLKTAGKRLAIFGGIAAGAFAILAKKVGDFDTNFQQTLNLLNEFDQAKFGDKLRTGVRKLSTEFGRNLGDVTKGLFDLISAGASAETALAQLRVGLKLSVASSVSASTAIDALTTVQNSFNLSTEDMIKTADFLFQINKAGKTTIEALSASIGNVASDAAGAGVSIEELGASISTLTFKGVKTEQTMTKLKALFIELAKIPFAKEVRKLGVDFKDTDLRTLGLNAVLQKLGKILPKNRKFLTQNGEALSALNKLLDAQTKFQKDLNGQLDRAGTVNKAYTDSSKTLGEQIKRLTATFNDMFIEVGTNLIPVFKEITPFITEAFKAIADGAKGAFENLASIADITSKVILIIGSLGPAIALAGVAFGVFGATAVVAFAGLAPALIVLIVLAKELFDQLKENADAVRNLARQDKELKKIVNKPFLDPFKKIKDSAFDLNEVFRETKKGFEEKSEIAVAFRLDEIDAFNRSVDEQIIKLKRLRKGVKAGTVVTAGAGRTRRENLELIDEEIKKINELKKTTLEKIPELKIDTKLAIETIDFVTKFKTTFSRVFDNAKEVFEEGAKKLEKPFELFQKITGQIGKTFSTIKSFALAQAEQQRAVRLEALTASQAKEIFSQGLLGIESEFSPQELLSKISDTISSASQASFVGLEQFQKNLQLSFLNVEDKKDVALIKNTKGTEANTKAVKELVRKIDQANVAGGAGAAGNFMLPLGV